MRHKVNRKSLRLLLPFLLATAAPLSVVGQSLPPDGPGIPTIALTGGPGVAEPSPNPPDQQSQWNMELAGWSDLQGRSAYQPIIINEGGREIAYVGHHTGSAMNPLTGVVEPNGTSIVDVTDPAKPKYLAHIQGSDIEAGEEAGGSQMVRVCSGSVLPHGVRGKWYLLRPLGSKAQEIYDVTDPSHPTRLTQIVGDLDRTHKNWWECDTGIAYLVANAPAEGWKGQHMKIYDLSDPAKPPSPFPRLWSARTSSQTRPSPGIVVAGHRDSRHDFGWDCQESGLWAYGTGANGVIQILDRKKLLTAFENPKKPTTEEMLAPQVGYLTMSPDQGAHTTFPIFGEPMPGFQGHTALRNQRSSDCRIFRAARTGTCSPGPGRRARGRASGLPRGHQQRSNPVASWQRSACRKPGDYCGKGGRFGTHSVAESFYPPYYGKIAIFSWFNAGTRVFDIRDPFAVQEVAYFIPAPNKNTMAFCPEDGVSHPAGDPKITAACQKVIETNNVEVDDRGLIHTDRPREEATYAYHAVNGPREGDCGGEVSGRSFRPVCF